MKLMEQKTSNLKIVAPKVVVPLTAEKKKLLAQYAEVRIHILRLCPICIIEMYLYTNSYWVAIQDLDRRKKQ